MPHDTEKLFFKTAFQLLDERNGTKWVEKYNELIRRSRDGRIDWNDIPGLLLPRGPKGYTGALKTICDSVIAIKLENKQNKQIRATYLKLVELAKEVYQGRRGHQNDVQRQRGLFTYVFFKFSLFTSFQDEDTVRHSAAIEIWKLTPQTLQKENSLFELGLWDALFRLMGDLK